MSVSSSESCDISSHSYVLVHVFSAMIRNLNQLIDVELTRNRILSFKNTYSQICRQTVKVASDNQERAWLTRIKSLLWIMNVSLCPSCCSDQIILVSVLPKVVEFFSIQSMRSWFSAGLDQAGLASTIAYSISLLPNDLQGMFWANIGLIGGNTKIPGLRERLWVVYTHFLIGPDSIRP